MVFTDSNILISPTGMARAIAEKKTASCFRKIFGCSIQILSAIFATYDPSSFLSYKLTLVRTVFTPSNLNVSWFGIKFFVTYLTVNPGHIQILKCSVMNVNPKDYHKPALYCTPPLMGQAELQPPRTLGVNTT